MAAEEDAAAVAVNTHFGAARAGDKAKAKAIDPNDPRRVRNVFAFGWGDHGRLGLGDGDHEMHTGPVCVTGFSKRVRVVQAACGSRHSLFLTETWKVLACGDGVKGQCGLGEGAGIISTPCEVEALTGQGVRHIFAQHNNSYCLNENGQMFSWGENRHAVLGHGDTETRWAPDQVFIQGQQIRFVAPAENHTMICTHNERVWVWGHNTQGQLGLGHKEFVLQPTRVQEFNNRFPVFAIAAGREHSLCVTECVTAYDGKVNRVVFAFGNGKSGRLGIGDEVSHDRPEEIRVLTHLTRMGNAPVVSVVCGSTFSAAITGSGTVYSWGDGSNGQLGHGDGWDKYAPLPVPNLHAVVQLAIGSRHALALNSEGALYSWGLNFFGENGLTDTRVRLQPHFVTAFRRSTVSFIAAGEKHSVGLTNGMLRLARNEPDYREWFHKIDKDPSEHHDIQTQMEHMGLDPEVLDEPDSILPGQPGTGEEVKEEERIEAGLEYCANEPNYEDRNSYRVVYSCSRCRLKFICRACARHCHRNHFVDVNIIRAHEIPRGECDCGVRDGICNARIDKVKVAFFALDVRKTGFIEADRLKELLERITKQEVLDDDLETAMEALVGQDGRVALDKFQEWFKAL